MKVINVVGARPNFMKIAPLMDEYRRRGEIRPILVHTGQHYDAAMSKFFFDDLGIPEPDHYLGVGSASHAVQTARVMEGFEPILLEEKPDLVLVVGDVNSTIACALTAVKMGVPVAHVEAGLRSFDREMPEEINRVLTDAISDLLFTTERGAAENLIREGVSPERIHFVGNVMIDTLLKHRDRASASTVLDSLGVAAGRYGLVTLHRPSNVDDRVTLEGLIRALAEVSADLPLVFPCHPRTRQKLEAHDLPPLRSEAGRGVSGILTCDPLGYFDFLRLMDDARLVLTDSGGIQEETTILETPCLTLRENTERPVTVTEGTNAIVGVDPEVIVAHAREALSRPPPSGRRPELWDGRAGERIVSAIEDVLLPSPEEAVAVSRAAGAGGATTP